MSVETRKRVLKTARKLGYVPNSAAEMLVSGRSRSIGVVLSRPELMSLDGFIPILIHGLNEICRERGYRLAMEAVHDPPQLDDYLDLAKSKRIDSMIVINPRRRDAGLKKVIESNFPVLVFGSSDRPQESALATQERLASRHVVRHLISLGHRRIAHISHASLEYVAVHRRLEGYRGALEAAKLPWDEALFAEGDFTCDSGYRAMKKILASKAHPTALFAGNDTIAVGAMLAIREAGLSIPEDFAVVGYDDLPVAAYASPPLTTVRTHPFEQGKLLALAAIRLMDHERVESQQNLVPLNLIVRDSCGAKSKAQGAFPIPELARRKPGTRQSKQVRKAPPTVVEL